MIPVASVALTALVFVIVSLVWNEVRRGAVCEEENARHAALALVVEEPAAVGAVQVPSSATP